MKRSLLLFCLLMITVFNAKSQNSDSKNKSGWNFGALPTITYNSDLGFQYGALVNFFHYGDGSQYPEYRHNVYVEASRFTKGSAIYRVSYDSKYLIPGIRITSDLAYLPDLAYDFFGFNGFESVYNADWENDEAGDVYKSRMFYRYQNKNFRFKTDIQFPLRDERFSVLAGFNLQNYNIDKVDIDKLNKGKDEDELLNDESLYNQYKKWEVISEEEANGGFVPLLKAGLVFDTRDNEPNPMKGIWTEAFVFGAPGFLGAESSFVKFNVTHRQYFTLIERDLSIAYRVGYQGTIAGHAPFYYQTQIETSQMKDQLGLGGNKTIRGINRNRVVADGFAYGNIELRWKAVHFQFINQNFYIGLNGFFDFGQVTQKISITDKVEAIDFNAEGIDKEQYFNFNHEGNLHTSAGAGLRIVMNENFIIAVDYGMSLNQQDGDKGIYIGLNYLF